MTLNSDDPPMFGTTLTEEYRRAASVLGLSRARLAELAANGVRASFLDPGAKQALLAEIERGRRGLRLRLLRRAAVTAPSEPAGHGPAWPAAPTGLGPPGRLPWSGEACRS